MKVGIYARVSTSKQDAGDKTSIREQVKACRSWASSRKARVVDVYTEAVSGTIGGDERQELGRAILDAKARRFDKLIVFDLNRLARDLLIQETIVADLARADVEVVALNVPESDGPAGDLIRQVFGAIAQYDRAMLTWRMKLGRDAVRATRGFCEGQSPYGYRKRDGTIERVDDEQAAIRVMRGLRSQRPPASFRAIAGELDRRGIPPRRGSKWEANTVRRILERKTPVSRARTQIAR